MINELIKPGKGAVKKRSRKGRGNASGMGGECGRGHKGQKSRSGYKSRPGFEGGQMPLYKRLPKKPGQFNPFSIVYQAINLRDLEEMFEPNTEVTLDLIQERGLAKKNQIVKILGSGEITKPLKVYAHKFSESATEKIKKASGECIILQKNNG